MRIVREFKQHLKKAAQGRIIVIIARRLYTIKHDINIVVMSEGRIIEPGSHAELLEEKEAYNNLIEAHQIVTEQEFVTKMKILYCRKG